MSCVRGAYDIPRCLFEVTESSVSRWRIEIFTPKLNESTEQKSFPCRTKKTYWNFITKECQLKWKRWNCWHKSSSCWRKTEVTIEIALSVFAFSARPRGASSVLAILNCFSVSLNEFFSAVTSLIFDDVTSEIIMHKVTRVACGKFSAFPRSGFEEAKSSPLINASRHIHTFLMFLLQQQPKPFLNDSELCTHFNFLFPDFF